MGNPISNSTWSELAVVSVLDSVGMRFCEALNFRGGIVSGLIVDDDGLEVLVVLVNEALKAIIDHIALVISRNDHTDSGHSEFVSASRVLGDC